MSDGTLGVCGASELPTSTGTSMVSRCVVGITLEAASSVMLPAMFVTVLSVAPSSMGVTLPSTGMVPGMVVMTGAARTMTVILTGVSLSSRGGVASVGLHPGDCRLLTSLSVSSACLAMYMMSG